MGKPRRKYTEEFKRDAVRMMRNRGTRTVAEVADDLGVPSNLLHRWAQKFEKDALAKRNPEGETLVHTLVQLGKALSIETLAEGIEQESELSVLRSEQCDSGQGFLFARPLDADAVETFLRTWDGRAVGSDSRAHQL